MRFDVFFAENTDKEVTENEVKKLLASKNPEFAYVSAFIGRDNYKQFKDLYEAKILESPYWTFKYVADVLNHIRGDTSRPHNRWPKGESVIATDAYASWLYARYIIYGRWPMGEKAIFDSEDPQHKDIYTDFLNDIGYQDEDNEEQQDDVIQRDLITNRFQGKEIVSLDDSIDYAAERNKRWPKLEKYILYLHFPHYGTEYAKKVIKGRWVEYENYLKKYYSVSSHYMDDYLKMLNDIGYEDEDNEELSFEAFYDNFTPKTANDVLEIAKDLGKRLPEYEHLIINSNHPNAPTIAYEYLKKIINKDVSADYDRDTWPEAESLLAKDGDVAYRYALYYINAKYWDDEEYDNIPLIRFPLGEPEIAKDAYTASRYARYILKNRFPQGEKAISKDKYEYQKYIEFLNSIGYEDEDNEEQDDVITRPLIRDMIGDVDIEDCLVYAERRNKRWPELEKIILNSGEFHSAIIYAERVIKGRWLELENILNNSSFASIFFKDEYIKMLNDIGYEDEDNEELL